METPAKTSRPDHTVSDNIARIVVAIPLCLAVQHAVRSRTAHEFLLNSALVSLALLGIFATSSVWELRGKGLRLRLPKREELYFIPLVLAIVLLGGAVAYSIGASLKDGFQVLYSAALTRTGSIVVFTSITLLSGTFLFYSRMRYRALYGLTEALVGLTVAATRFASTSSPSARDSAFYLATLTAGVYLVVRGFDNIHQSLTKEPRDRLVTRLFGSATGGEGTGNQGFGAEPNRRPTA